MRQPRRVLTDLGLLLACCLAVYHSPLIATTHGDEGSAPLLTVKLASGREFTAHVDARTDADRLWLRFSSGGGSILRPIAWDRITAARSDGQDVPLAELPELAVKIKSAAPPRSEEFPALPEQPPPSSVASIRIDVWLANWDGDVETDGLSLQLTPVDERGNLVPVRGTVDVELFAARERKYHEAPQSRGWSTELVQRWSEGIEQAEVGREGIILRLPFGAIHPEFTSSIDDWGLVHVRLVVPGSGVFEQSLDGVRLRNWAPVRSGRFGKNGQWFFSTEKTGR